MSSISNTASQNSFLPLTGLIESREKHSTKDSVQAFRSAFNRQKSPSDSAISHSTSNRLAPEFSSPLELELASRLENGQNAPRSRSADDGQLTSSLSSAGDVKPRMKRNSDRRKLIEITENLFKLNDSLSQPTSGFRSEQRSNSKNFVQSAMNLFIGKNMSVEGLDKRMGIVDDDLEIIENNQNLDRTYSAGNKLLQAVDNISDKNWHSDIINLLDSRYQYYGDEAAPGQKTVYVDRPAHTSTDAGVSAGIAAVATIGADVAAIGLTTSLDLPEFDVPLIEEIEESVSILLDNAPNETAPSITVSTPFDTAPSTTVGTPFDTALSTPDNTPFTTAPSTPDNTPFTTAPSTPDAEQSLLDVILKSYSKRPIWVPKT